MTIKNHLWVLFVVFVFSCSIVAEENQTVEFCLQGEFDLGLRQQGFHHQSGEHYPMRWCVTYESNGQKVQFSSSGNINADAMDEFTLRYLDDNTLQIVDGQHNPVVMFVGAMVQAEAGSHRRIDPRWLLKELETRPEYIVTASNDQYTLRYPGNGYPVEVYTQNRRVTKVTTKADFPLRGTVEVVWRWNWSTSSENPQLTLSLGDTTLFDANSSRRYLSEQQASDFWATSDAPNVMQIPGKVWPSRVNMSVNTLSPGVHVINDVRTGFHHLVVETKKGLVVIDAPAGWVEVQQIPPADLVPGLGVSGLSELFVDFLRRQFGDTPIDSVILTHFHDDHAGGARAFAAASAKIYAPAADVEYLNSRFNLASMPQDRLTGLGLLTVLPLTEQSHFGEDQRRVVIKTLPGNPHVKNAVAAWLPHNKILYVSDIKIPPSDAKVDNAEQKARYCWFANWAKQTLPEDYSVMDNHSQRRIQAETVKRFAELNEC